MATGYLVTLGNGSLDNGDAISGTQSTFSINQTIGSGSWTWTGVYQNNGNSYTNINDTGTYYTGSDGNVYFVPDNYFITSGTATASSPPAYSLGDGVVTGTGGNDVIDGSFNDADGDFVTPGDDTVNAGGGNDTVDAGLGDDSVDGGTGADSIYGGQGEDSLTGGDGDDTIYGDDDGTIEGEMTSLNWANQTDGGTPINDEASVLGGFTATSANGDIDIAVSVTAEENFTGASMEKGDPLYDFNGVNDTSSIELYGGGTGAGQNAATMTLDFSSNDPANISGEVTDVVFGIHDLDELVGQFLDQVIITAYDANGNPVAVVLTPGDPATITVNNATGTATAVGGSGGAGNTDSLTGFLEVSIAGPVAQIVIDYNNVDTAFGNHAIRVGDLQFNTIPLDNPANNSDTIDGGLGDDDIFGGSGDDSIQGGAGADTIEGGGGADVISGGTGNDSIQGDAGNDSIAGGSNADRIDGGADNDTVSGDGGADSLTGGTGDDTIYGGDGNDTIGDWSTDNGNDTMYGGAGNDDLNGGNGDDMIYGGDGDDTLTGASDDDSLFGGLGNDRFNITDDHEVDVIEGGEDLGDGDVDTVGFSNFASTDGVTVTATGAEAGTYDFDGTAGTGSFTEIERIETTDFDDTVDMSADGGGVDVSTNDGDDVLIGGAGDDTLDVGAGADTVTGGAGNDTIDLGDAAPDGDADVVVLADGFGDDIVTNFDAPTPNGDGTFTGIDTLDVSALFDLPLGDPDRTPVLTNDVVVTDDGSGNALLTFPNGETLTLVGISPADADNPFYLNAIGIPMPDGTVEGTSGADVIDGSYTGDPDGDLVDAGDAILPGDTGNDDLIYGYGGNDNIAAGDGADEIYGGADDDTINAGDGDDTVFGGTGDDAINVDAGNGADVIEGGEDAGNGDVDTLTFADGSGPDGVDVTMTGDEAGTYSYPTDGGSGSFSEIEEIVLTDEDDTFDGTAATGGNTVDGGAGDDVLTGSSGNDSFTGGTGNDTLNANQGDDELDGGAGDDTIYGDEGEDVIVGGADNDALYGGADNDTIDGGTGDDTVEGGDGDDTLVGGDGADTIIGGADQDVIYGGAGDVINGSESGVDNDTLIVSGVDYIDYDDLNPENGVVYFEGGGSLTFTNIENVIVSDRDGTVSGTAGDDLIDASYVGDPDGDQVDDTDAILVGHEPNDDLIEAGGGNDTIIAGAGDDSIYAGTGNDTVMAGDGADTIFGEAGDDLISGDAGNDTAFGGTGDDTFNGGAGDDMLLGGDDEDTFVLEAGYGSDVIEGGEGGTDNDTVHATQNVDTTVTASGDEAGSISDGTSTATFSEIETIETEGGNDTIDLANDSAGMTVDAGAGNDVITGGSGDDSLIGGDGADAITGGAGNDTMSGGQGNDSFVLGEGFGTDSITGGEDDPFIDVDVLDAGGMTSDVTLQFTADEQGTLTQGTNSASFDEIELFTLGSGNDTVIGDDGDDLVYAGAGDDSMIGGEGADTFYGGSGDDDITFAEGDNMSGGSGDDTFTLEDLGEPTNGTITIDGGAGGENGGDTLQLGTLTNLTQAVRDTFVDDGTGSYSGTITLDDGTILNFSEIENIICFTPGTRIATPQGLRAIEDLKVGDYVVTRDHGLQPIRWIESRTVPAVERFAPVRIRSNVLAGQETDLVVSPQHRVLFQGYRAELLFGESEVLVAAKHLVDGMDVTQDESEMVTYVHMLFDQHEIIYAEGAATESFHPGDIGFSAVGDAAREELFAIFPELRADPNQYGNTARRCLKSHEAKLIRS